MWCSACVCVTLLCANKRDGEIAKSIDRPDECRNYLLTQKKNNNHIAWCTVKHAFLLLVLRKLYCLLCCLHVLSNLEYSIRIQMYFLLFSHTVFWLSNSLMSHTHYCHLLLTFLVRAHGHLHTYVHTHQVTYKCHTVHTYSGAHGDWSLSTKI